MNSPGPVEHSKTLAPVPAKVWGLRFAVFVLVAGLGTFCDLSSKRSVFETYGYPNGQSRVFLDSWVMFRFHTGFNRGALWGIGQNYTMLFALLSLLAVGVILYWLFVRGAARSWILTICLALIMAGTLGNLYDRLGWHGLVDDLDDPIFGVRDFLLFRFGTYNWPVFNLADVFLVTGAVCLIAQALFGSMKSDADN
jgi:signal peptidase II